MGDDVAGGGVLHNLPAPVSSFIGREAELAEERRLVSGSRLIIRAAGDYRHAGIVTERVAG
jgi:hypothetical protein